MSVLKFAAHQIPLRIVGNWFRKVSLAIGTIYNFYVMENQVARMNTMEGQWKNVIMATLQTTWR